MTLIMSKKGIDDVMKIFKSMEDSDLLTLIAEKQRKKQKKEQLELLME